MDTVNQSARRTTRTNPTRTAKSSASNRRVLPSIVDTSSAKPFTMGQELEVFGRWTSDTIWVPPKDASTEIAETMLDRCGLLASQEESWETVREVHQDDFTQVREIDMAKASIRLPKGKLFMTVTEQKDFDKITDKIPECVQTRLEEFMAGPGKQRGVKISYLKPLCIEVDDQLLFTSQADLFAAIDKVKQQVFTQYRQRYVLRRPRRVLSNVTRASFAVPGAIIRRAMDRRQRDLDAHQAKLEFQRRKTALRAANHHRKSRTDGCTFDDMLSLTNPLQRADVIQHFAFKENLSDAKRNQMLMMAAGTLPWFVALSMGITYLVSVGIAVATPPVMVCDPAFVAELPGRKGELLKIGHFDEIAPESTVRGRRPDDTPEDDHTVTGDDKEVTT